MDWTGILVPITVFAASAYIVYVAVTNRRRTQVARMQADLHGRLLEKFGSSQELVQYLETKGGQAFIEPLADPRGPYTRILGSVQVGIVLTMTGGTLALLRDVIGGRGPLVAGTLLLALGVGFLISAAVSFQLSKSWGLLGRRPSEQ